METKQRIWCPTCGDVTDGHPAENAAIAGLIENGFTTSYTKV